MNNEKIERQEVLKKAKKIMKKIDDKEEAKKIIKILIASYEINPFSFVPQK